jgi:hypothetical protein
MNHERWNIMSKHSRSYRPTHGSWGHAGGGPGHMHATWGHGSSWGHGNNWDHGKPGWGYNPASFATGAGLGLLFGAAAGGLGATTPYQPYPYPYPYQYGYPPTQQYPQYPPYPTY